MTDPLPPVAQETLLEKERNTKSNGLLKQQKRVKGMKERIKWSAKWGTVNGEGHEKGADEKGEGEVTVGTVEGNGAKKKKIDLTFSTIKNFLPSASNVSFLSVLSPQTPTQNYQSRIIKNSGQKGRELKRESLATVFTPENPYEERTVQESDDITKIQKTETGDIMCMDTLNQVMGNVKI